MIKKIFLPFFCLFFLFFFFLFKGNITVRAQAIYPFTTAYTTLSNSRFSFKAAIASVGVANSASYATIKLGGLSANDTTDSDTNNLFNGDSVCFNGMASNGCANQYLYTVVGVGSTSSFNFTPNLGYGGTTNLVYGDRVIATQSGQMTITFKPNSTLVAADKLLIDIPAASSSYNDGIPDSTGFDSSHLPSSNLVSGTDPYTGASCSGSACLSPSGVGISSATFATAASKHTITVILSSGLLNTTTYTLTIGHATNALLRFLNPAPATAAHVRGASDSYSIRLYSQKADGTAQDDTTMKVNPVDGVLVSANIELSLTYTIAGISSSTDYSSYCGSPFTTTSATTATSVPFGSISSWNTFYKTAQTHTIATNATNGYTLSVNYDMPLNLGVGATVPGQTIPDTTCAATPCTTSTSRAWTDATTYTGFGYTVGNITGTDRDSSFTTGYFKPFSSSAVNIASKTSPTSSSQLAVCYQLAAPSTQRTGYYKDKLTYVAVPMF